jgi:hypothetical protein
MMCLKAGFIMDIVVWLGSLGLGKYEAAFRENEIDETVRHARPEGGEGTAGRTVGA